MFTPYEKETARSEAASVASAVLSGSLGPIDGCIALHRLSNALVANWAADEDFIVFGVVASETDHLPFGDVRNKWSSEALSRADSEIEDIENTFRDRILAACKNVISRYAASN